MLENTENRERESRDTGNIWYRRHKTETKKNKQRRMFCRPLYANKQQFRH